MFCDRASLAAHPGVEGRLPAAGLPGRKFHLYPGPVEHMYDRFAQLGVKCIDDAGRKELGGDAHLDIILTQNHWLPVVRLMALLDLLNILFQNF
jgi:hypothetical protein